jgi:hypothetical protein
MIDTDTFMTALYVIVDDICNSEPASLRRTPGPNAQLSTSEIITLAMFAQFKRFSSERDFYRFADRNLRSAFPGLPNRIRYNRLARAASDLICTVGLRLAEMLGGNHSVYQAVDGTAVPIRDSHRRGNGWFCGDADIGKSNRLGWYEGFRVLAAADCHGVITGFCFAPASVNERHIAEAFFAVRRHPNSRVLSVGVPGSDVYLLDKGFNGPQWHDRWRDVYHAEVLCAPQQNVLQPWPAHLRRWLSSHRQIIETVFEKLHNVFGLCHDRPHQLDGFSMRLAAKVAMHNFCIWMNRQLGRDDLAFVDLVALD